MSTAGSTKFQAPTADGPVLAEIVRRLVEAYHPERIYLFGSAARGDAGPHSEFEKRVHRKASLPTAIIRAGILLHAA